MTSDDKLKFQCHACGSNLVAGKKHIGRSMPCPKCASELVVPDLCGEWFMRDSEGEVFGPCSKVELDSWANSGAMNIQCSIREGQRPWIPAANAYPHVAGVVSPGGKQPINSNPLSPGIAVLLSLLITGLPQMLMGQVGKGIAILCGGVLFAVLTGCIGVPLVWAFAAVDAFKIATKIQEGRPVSEWEFF